MSSPLIYVSFPHTAHDALTFYAQVFGGELNLHTFEDFGRTDGPPDAIAHGVLDGPVSLAGSDITEGDRAVSVEGIKLALLGTAGPQILHQWFEKLADGGSVVDPLTRRPWGATDGQVVDRYGLCWLIGYEGNAE
ncbi:PhnB protein [Okibacterium sp. HSC-33S16]|uniref:VOC family protein n=1 Tax=Okibacterium sp. HSC-33S16 TaxID=2910965 RepID=UPI0020A103D5|nr:VOC family protein [Okibacterium sp. HSC-33S16]MCP2030365.1 PhnB protein [Okibacterium sp. HSC-33S16]